MKRLSITLLAFLIIFPAACMADKAANMNTYDDLLVLFEDWRKFENPPLLEGAPDYTAQTTARRHLELKTYQSRLTSFDVDDWPVAKQVDWHIVRAEMNGMDFNIRVLQPWVRDPAYYTSVWTAQSDTPAHEGPTHHAPVELWTYQFPLNPQAESRLIEYALQQAGDNIAAAARMIGTSRPKIYRYLMKKERSTSKT